MTRKQYIVREPEHKTDRGTLGLGVERDPFHGIAISSFIDGEAYDTVYVDDEDVPELVRALTEIALEGETDQTSARDRDRPSVVVEMDKERYEELMPENVRESDGGRDE